MVVAVMVGVAKATVVVARVEAAMAMDGGGMGGGSYLWMAMAEAATAMATKAMAEEVPIAYTARPTTWGPVRRQAAEEAASAAAGERDWERIGSQSVRRMWWRAGVVI
jgi:hypothetical protein